MRFYTKEECDEWLKGRERVKPDTVEGLPSLRILYPSKSHRLYYFAYWMATELLYREPALLWITEWEIWGSCENWHLYYRLRQHYGDNRLLHEAPGHLFLGYEAEDLISFLQLAMLNGWGGYVLTQVNYANIFFSHDEFIDLFSTNEDILQRARKALGGKGAD